MKLLVFGSKGWIGSQFIKLLNDQNINYVNGLSRVNEIDNLREEILKIEPTHIVSFIGRTHGKIGNKEYTTILYFNYL